MKMALKWLLRLLKMATKKVTYIGDDLDWAEERLQSLKAYIDANPLDKLKDRIEWKPTSKGGAMPMVVASIEQQIKCVRDTLKDYLQMLPEINRLREVEEKKAEIARGGADVPWRMRGE